MKVIKINYCTECPYFRKGTKDTEHNCTCRLGGRKITDEKIPPWCLLDDV
jgi:hypothetical protein